MFNVIQDLPPELITASVSALPVSELRGAIPLGLGVFKLSPLSTFFFAVLGNIAIVFVLLLGLRFVSGFLGRRSLICKRFFNWLFERTTKLHQKKFQRFGDFALVTLVALPLPFTGAWTGSLAAFVFGIPFKKAFPLISLGVIMAGIIVTLATMGTIQIL